MYMNDLSFRLGCRVKEVDHQVHYPDRFKFLLSVLPLIVYPLMGFVLYFSEMVV